MGRQIFAPAKSALPPSMVVVYRKEPGRRAVRIMSREGRYIARSQEGGAMAFSKK